MLFKGSAKLCTELKPLRSPISEMESWDNVNIKPEKFLFLPFLIFKADMRQLA